MDNRFGTLLILLGVFAAPGFGQKVHDCERIDVNGECMDQRGNGDADKDGVVDAWDFCPGSTLDTPGNLHGGHWAATHVNDDGFFEFEKGPSCRFWPWKHRTRFAPQLSRTGGCTCVQVADALGRSRRKAERFGCRERDLARWTRQIGAKLLAGPPLTLAGLNQLFGGEIDTDALEVFANNVLSVRLPPPTPYCCATYFCYCYGGLDCLGMTLVPLLCDSNVRRGVDSSGVCSKGSTFPSCSNPDCWCP